MCAFVCLVPWVLLCVCDRLGINARTKNLSSLTHSLMRLFLLYLKRLVSQNVLHTRKQQPRAGRSLIPSHVHDILASYTGSQHHSLHIIYHITLKLNVIGAVTVYPQITLKATKKTPRDTHTLLCQKLCLAAKSNTDAAAANSSYRVHGWWWWWCVCVRAGGARACVTKYHCTGRHRMDVAKF